MLNTILHKSVVFLVQEDALVLQGNALTNATDRRINIVSGCIGIARGRINIVLGCIGITEGRINNATDTLTLQGTAKFNSLQINEMLYLETSN